MREKVRRVLDGMAGVFTMVIILGGIISGVFTATEAGAAASMYALFLTVFVYKEIKISELPEILWECCLTNAVVMLLIATCSVYSWILTYENLPTLLADNFFNLIQSKWAFLLILNGFLLIVGMFVDMTPALIMLVPMLIPLAQKFGIDMVHLGLIMVINLAFGLTTPPVGTALFVALKVGNISMEKIIPPLHAAAGLHVRGAVVRHLRARGLPVAAARIGAHEIATPVGTKCIAIRPICRISRGVCANDRRAFNGSNGSHAGSCEDLNPTITLPIIGEN